MEFKSNGQRNSILTKAPLTDLSMPTIEAIAKLRRKRMLAKVIEAYRQTKRERYDNAD
jgi:hypothetical protein